MAKRNKVLSKKHKLRSAMLLQDAISLHQAGRIHEAETSYRSIIDKYPNHLDAIHLLGVIAIQQGKYDLSVTYFEQAINIKPDFADAHYNLGNALNNQGQKEEAIVHFKQAINIKPNFAEAHLNLGNILNDQGQNEEAIVHFKQAINIKSDFADAHYNLGNALSNQGQKEEAIIHFKQAINIKPDFAEVNYNLGIIYMEQGKLGEALTYLRLAIAINPQIDLFWIGLAKFLETYKFTSIDDNILQDLLGLLEHPRVFPKNIIHSIISALRCHPEITYFIKHVNNGELSTDTYEEISKKLSSIPLLLRIMDCSCIYDLEFERMFTSLRRHMILELKLGESIGSDNSLLFPIALALHCFTNEYIFQVSSDETIAVNQLCKKISTLVTSGKEIPPIALVSLAAYKPLNQFTWATNLLDYDWPDEMKIIIDRQITEPLKERTLKNQIPVLTPIEDTISKSVRDQYEENPYPRWIKTNLHTNAVTIREDLQADPLRFFLGDYISPENPQILVAGCGTGQHAISTATRFSNSHVLAVDLSLSSLSYALRKTNELNLLNIEYAQADIMELGSLGKSFDLIESVGVLHHLNDPLSGWKILVDLLRPGGIMKIGLYSEIARQAIVYGRSLIFENEYTTSSEDIRRCRKDIIMKAEEGNQNMAKICTIRDFFNLSNFRDLLFHVQEHRFTIPQIEANIKELDLDFLGFEIMDQNIMAKFKTTYKDKTSLTSLSAWHQFETQNPDTFLGMYQFWLKKT